MEQEGAAQVHRRLDPLVEDPDLGAVADPDDVALDDHLVAGAQLQDLGRIGDREGDLVRRHQAGAPFAPWNVPATLPHGPAHGCRTTPRHGTASASEPDARTPTLGGDASRHPHGRFYVVACGDIVPTVENLLHSPGSAGARPGQSPGARRAALARRRESRPRGLPAAAE